MSWYEDRDRLQLIARRTHRHITLVRKRGWFWEALAVCICWLIPRDVFMTRYATTIGNFIAIPPNWTAASAEAVLAHETGHTVWFWICGLGIHPLVGVLIYGLAYVLLLPVGFNPVRFWSELYCDRRYWRWLCEHGRGSEVLQRARTFGKAVVGRKYGWSWPKKWGASIFQQTAWQLLIDYAKGGPR